jgi:hypothetical protein
MALILRREVPKNRAEAVKPIHKFVFCQGGVDSISCSKGPPNFDFVLQCTLLYAPGKNVFSSPFSLDDAPFNDGLIVIKQSRIMSNADLLLLVNFFG